MGEQASKIGKKLEGYGEYLFPNMGWIELAHDKEIKCTRTSHKKRTHGIDLLFMYENPYSDKRQGVVVECKNRQMKSITQKDIEEWVKELIKNIECAQSAPELENIDWNHTTLNTGLLLIHANDAFDEEKFYKSLSEIKIPTRRNPINIFVAGNDKIDEWNSLLAVVRGYGNTFQFVYPSINGFSRTTQKAVTIHSLYSKYILAESQYITKEKTEDGYEYDKPNSQKILIFLDEIKKENFLYAWDLFKHYQMEGASKYVFLFYPHKSGDVEFVKEEFLRTLKNCDNPIKEQEAQKIELRFIDNRSLSPIEVGGEQ